MTCDPSHRDGGGRGLSRPTFLTSSGNRSPTPKSGPASGAPSAGMGDCGCPARGGSLTLRRDLRRSGAGSDRPDVLRYYARRNTSPIPQTREELTQGSEIIAVHDGPSERCRCDSRCQRWFCSTAGHRSSSGADRCRAKTGRCRFPVATWNHGGTLPTVHPEAIDTALLELLNSTPTRMRRPARQREVRLRRMADENEARVDP